jgi:diguanylate cyclase (GGDEF)-like protein
MAVSLQPPFDEVWEAVADELAAALAGGDEQPFLSAIEVQAAALARDRTTSLAALLSALDDAFAPLRAAGRPDLAHAAIVHAAVAYAEALEQTLDQTTAEIDFLRPEDPLTGVMKEREIDRRLGVELDRCRRMELSLGLLIVGVDCLSAVRHHGGPGECGELLQRIARLLGESLRQYDAIGRRGEDAFIVVLPDVSRRGLQTVVERFRHDLDDEVPAAAHGRFSFAVGHLDFIDVGGDEALTLLDDGLARARAAADRMVWI